MKNKPINKILMPIGFLALVFVANMAHAEKIQLVTENFAPFQFKEADGTLSGFAIELVEAVKKRAGISAKIQVLPWARAYQLAQREPGVFIFSIARTKERESLFQWIGNYFQISESFFALNSREDIVLNTIEEAKKYTTAVTLGDAPAMRLDKLGFVNEVHIRSVADLTQSIKMLHLGRVDLVSNAWLGFSTTVRKMGLPIADFKIVLDISKTEPKEIYRLAAFLTPCG